MKPRTILIADDEAPARQRLRELLGGLDEYQVVGEAATGDEALERALRLEPDILLLDVRMPGMDGIEVTRRLSAEHPNPPAVVLTTAFADYAVDAFDAQALGYLLKPVRRERLQRALAHAERLRPAAAGQEGTPDYVTVRYGQSLERIPVEQISCFRAEQKYVIAYHPGGNAVLDTSLKALEERLGERYFRAHRNALVALEHVVGLHRAADGGLVAELRYCPEPIPVSRRQAADLKRQLRDL